MQLVGPKLTPKDFIGHRQYPWTPKSTHIIVNDVAETAKAFDANGTLLFKIPCLARGIYGPDWRVRNADTPPGLYVFGQAYLDFEKYGAYPAFNRTLRAYGWCSFDLIDLEGQETGVGREGIMYHGGGSNNGWPGAWAPYQTLWPTHGCVRGRNKDLQDLILPRYRYGTVFCSVYQDAP